MPELNIAVMAGTLFAMFCAWMLLHALGNYRKALESSSWPQANGEMNKVELWGTRNINGRMEEVEKLSLEYIFEAHGKTYTGTTVAFYTLVYPETVNFANSHPANSKVSVFYENSDPANSVLIPGPKRGNKRYSDIILASIGLVVAVGIALLGVLGIIG